MIEKWKIVETKEEKVLYLYLNKDYEFASDFFNKENFKEELKQIIEKIHFNGNKIYIMSASLILSTILLTNNIKEVQENHQYITKNTFDPILTTSIILDKKDLQETSKKQEEKKEEPSEKQSITQKGKKEQNKQNDQKTNTNQSKSTASQKESSRQQKVETKKQETIKSQQKNQTIVTVYRSNGKVEKIELEEYLIGVVAGEMPASFSSEALKAQAIIARTYTLKAIKTHKKLTDTVSTQVYKDNSQLKSMWKTSYKAYYNRIRSAVNETKGLTVKYNGNYIEALYFSTSNGYTENAENVFTNAFPYLQTVESTWDKNVSSYLKTVTLNYQEVLKKLGIEDRNASIEIISRNKSNRVSKIRVGNQEYSGAKFRTLLSLRSADFDIIQEENTLKITTRGFGHGVGMSQYGANEMAKLGKTYKQIIQHYYKGVTIS